MRTTTAMKVEKNYKIAYINTNTEETKPYMVKIRSNYMIDSLLMNQFQGSYRNSKNSKACEGSSNWKFSFRHFNKHVMCIPTETLHSQFQRYAPWVGGKNSG